MPSSRQSRILGLWTAAWLFVLLLVLLLRVGDIRLQWPALLVPVVWALVALRRGRRRPPAVRRRPEEDDEGYWVPEDEPRAPRQAPTRELPWLPDVPRDRREE